MTDKKLVLTTCGSAEEARRLAHQLVERRLAACVNIVPQIESAYRWQGKVETASEFLLLIKTTAAVFDSLRRAIQELHSYEVPECIAISIDAGTSSYLDWMAESVLPGS